MSILLAPSVFQNWVENLKANLGQGVFVFLLGILVVFFGISVIVLLISVIGKIMASKSNKTKSDIKVEVTKTVNNVNKPDENEVPDHVRVAIIAAITAYYNGSDVQSLNKCEFVVKKIRRI